MKKLVLIITIISAGFSILMTSCGKHVYFISYRELNDHALSARESRPKSFVVYNNGDTLKGNVLKKKRNAISGKATWTLDGKDIPLENIHSYQDELGYRLGNYSRILKGKLSMYAHEVDNTGIITNYSESAKTFKSQTVGRMETSFYMALDQNIKLITYNSLKEMMKNCQPAMNQIATELDGGMFKKRPTVPVNDYRALIRIFEIFNKCK